MRVVVVVDGDGGALSLLSSPEEEKGRVVTPTLTVDTLLQFRSLNAAFVDLARILDTVMMAMRCDGLID